MQEMSITLDTENPQTENTQLVKQKIYDMYFTQNEEKILLALEEDMKSKDPII